MNPEKQFVHERHENHEIKTLGPEMKHGGHSSSKTHFGFALFVSFRVFRGQRGLLI